jgi:two-component system NarL family sensor kinase
MKIKSKILLSAFLFILFLEAVILSIVIYEIKKSNEETISNIKKYYISTQEQRLKNLVELYKSSIKDLYENNTLDKSTLQAEAKKRLRNMFYDRNGYIFFVYDGTGANVLPPVKPYFEGKNLINMKDRNNVFFIKKLLYKAKSGGGVVRYYIWPKTSKNNQEAPELSYVIYLKNWDWMMGAGVYTDDIDYYIGKIKEKNAASLKKTISYIVGITILLIILVDLLLNFLFNKIINFVKSQWWYQYVIKFFIDL